MIRNRSPSSRGAQVNDTNLSRGRPERFRAAGLVFWFRADNVTIATGISSAVDLSGTGNTVTQGTGSAQPAQVLNAYNGKPTARFDATASQVLSKTPADLFGDGAYTLIAALKRGSAFAGTAGMFGVTDTTGNTLYMDGTKRSVLHPGVASNLSAVDVSDTALELWTATRAAAAAPFLRVNNVNDPLTSGAGMSAPGANAFLALGAYAPAGALAAFMTGDIAEAMAFTTAIPQSFITRISHYMGARYGVVA